jgi:ATP-dependent DNA helicase RecG
MVSIPNKIRDLMGLLCEVVLHEQEEIHFIEIKVPAYSVPISLRGRYYMRSGATNLELTGIELNEFLLKKAGKSWDDVIEENASLEDIDVASISKFTNDSKEKGRMPDTSVLSTIQILDKLHLTIGDKLKRAALILFGKDPSRFFPNIQVKIGRFGIDASDLKFHEIIEGNLVYLLNEVPIQLTYKFLTRPIKFEGLQREEKDLYPSQAIREMLLNALVHRTYTGAPIQMRVFDNQLSIWNEGNLPNGLSIEDLKKDHNSRPRNPIIANACFLAGYIDAWGRGTLKILNTCAEFGLPEPSIIEKNGGIEVTVFASNEDGQIISDASHTGLVKELVKELVKGLVKGLVKDLTSNQMKLLELVETHPNITKEEMAKHIGISTTAIDNNINTLKAKGLLERVGGRKDGYWKIVKPAHQ